jgi:hypothetical protein
MQNNMSILNSNLLSILISITLIYAILGVLVSTLVEWWNYKSKERGRMLKGAIIKLLSDPMNNEYGHLFYGHFMISGLRADHRPPQYISSSMFAEVLIDVVGKQAVHAQKITMDLNIEGEFKKYKVAGDAPPVSVMERFKAGLDMMNESPFKDMLLSFWHKSNSDYDSLKTLMAKWYDDYMDRVSGWYKTQIRKKLTVAGFVVAIALNIDTFHLLRVLSLDENLRSSLVNTAESVADNYTALSDSAKKKTNELKKVIELSMKDSVRLAEEYKKIDSTANSLTQKLKITDSLSIAYINKADSVIALAASLGIPIGWSRTSAPYTWIWKNPEQCNYKYQRGTGLWKYINNRNNCPGLFGWLKYLMGITITAFALSLGAPFWFELLVKLVNIRRAGKKPQSLTNKKNDK